MIISQINGFIHFKLCNSNDSKYVTGKGFRLNTGITQITFNIGFIWLPEPWRELPE